MLYKAFDSKLKAKRAYGDSALFYHELIRFIGLGLHQWLRSVCTVYVLEISILCLLFQLWLFNADTAVVTNVESLKAVVKTGIYSIRSKGIYSRFFLNFRSERVIMYMYSTCVVHATWSIILFVSLMPCSAIISSFAKEKTGRRSLSSKVWRLISVGRYANRNFRNHSSNAPSFNRGWYSMA